MLTNTLLGTSRSTAVLEEWCMPRIARWPPRPKHPNQRISIASNRRNPAWQAHPTTDSQVMQLSTHQPGAASTTPDKHPFHRGSPPRAWRRFPLDPLILPSQELVLCGAPGGTRTPDPLLRRQLLCPTELLALDDSIIA